MVVSMRNEVSELYGEVLFPDIIEGQEYLLVRGGKPAKLATEDIGLGDGSFLVAWSARAEPGEIVDSIIGLRRTGWLARGPIDVRRVAADGMESLCSDFPKVAVIIDPRLRELQ